MDPERIMSYMKRSKSDIQHLLIIRGLFLDADHSESGVITKRSLIKEISKHSYNFNPLLLKHLIADMSVDAEDKSADAAISYNILVKIIDVYSTQPLRNKKDANGSENFTQIMSYSQTPTEVSNSEVYDLL